MITPESPFTDPADMAKSLAWTGRFLADPAGLPVSFTLGGVRIEGIPAAWNPSTRKRRIDAHITEMVTEGTEPRSGLTLRVDCLRYADFPVVEWTAWLTNRGSSRTPILEDILALDGTFTGASPVLSHCTGDYYSGDGYIVREIPLQEGQRIAHAPTGGRPCDRAFPYYRVRFAECGLTLAIGWPAQWAASFEGSRESVRVKAGQEKTRLRLRPGETIRTPRITILSWAGGERRAANLWRRWYRAHILPRPDGLPLRPMLGGHGTDEGEEFTAATAENQARYIRRWSGKGIAPDLWWIDAGWYPCYNEKEKKRMWTVTGTWEPDAERFPEGLMPVSECAARHGADLLLWFEPERVRPGTRLEQEHPEWLLACEGVENRLLDLGTPACRQWLTDHVCRLIRENGIRIYRQDFNFEPLGHLRENEEPDRQGMRENLYVQGYLRYWDDLLERNPGLWIDSCASGGRRNDLETMRRSVPLHYTDFGYGDHPVKLSFQHVMFEWLPYFKESTLSWDREGPARYDRQVDSFSYHCALAPMILPAVDIARDDYDYGLMRRMLEIWRRAALLLLDGDYYPLTPIHRTAEKWVGRQFDRPEEGSGFLQGIRLPSCPQETLIAHPRALRSDGVYLFENPESGEVRECTGETLLRDGFAMNLAKREGAIWFYSLRAR